MLVTGITYWNVGAEGGKWYIESYRTIYKATKVNVPPSITTHPNNHTPIPPWPYNVMENIHKNTTQYTYATYPGACHRGGVGT